jgi:hypothetical protein
VEGSYANARASLIVRQGGYRDFSQKIAVQPGQKQIIRVAMEKDPQIQLPTTTAEIKLSVDPDRAAVFVDGVFVGHVAEFRGVGRAMLVAPGKRKITISLPGYKSFETELTLVANQKSEIKTNLIKASTLNASPTPDQE